MNIELLVTLVVLAFITILIRKYYLSYHKEQLTGKYYIRKNVGFKRDDIIVEVKQNNEVNTRLATKEDLKYLRDKYEINLN